MNETIILRHQLNAAPERVFDALTTTSALETWLAECADADVEQGRFQFWGRFTPEGDQARQELLEAERPRSLHFAWMLQGERTEVQIGLEPRQSGTRVDLIHSGLVPREGAAPWIRDWWFLALENLASFVENRGVGPRVDFTGFAQSVARIEADIDASPEEVFLALIEPARLERWIATKATVEPEVGGRYDFGWDHGPMKILELEPARKLAYSWQWSDTETVVTWELEGSGGKTHLTLVHSGFGPGPANEGYEVGWSAFVVSLKRMLELGDAWRRIEEPEAAGRS
jgi:uncharacterized protein YndB with AHSA1/START domain